MAETMISPRSVPVAASIATRGDAAIIAALKRANAKIGLDFAKVGPAGFIAPCTAGENFGGDANLRGNEDEHVGRRAFLGSGNTAGESQIAR